MVCTSKQSPNWTDSTQSTFHMETNAKKVLTSKEAFLWHFGSKSFVYKKTTLFGAYLPKRNQDLYMYLRHFRCWFGW